MKHSHFLAEHLELTRRYFLRAGAAGVVAGTLSGLRFADGASVVRHLVQQDKAGAQPDPYFTAASDFRDVSRGTPLPHSLPDDRKAAVGLTRETWQLEVIADPDQPTKISTPLSKDAGTAFDFAALMKLSETNSVRVAKVMTCLNLGCPLGMGLWEGVPLRDVIWLTQPRENLRRVFYYGYHNDDPKQMFRSSLPASRILEDPPGLPPVLLCYKLNGEWLDAERGGPVRVVVPEAYGFKSIKWLTHVVLTNLAHANDTYAEQNNDVDSPLKTFAATLSVPQGVKSGEPIAVSGYAQVGISGLSKVQVAIQSADTPEKPDDPWLTSLPWTDATVLPAPTNWSSLPDGRVPTGTFGFDDDGNPKSWPMPLTNAHWVTMLSGLSAGEYRFWSRSIDAAGHAQPMPRPFRKSGHAAIESVRLFVTE